MKLTSTQQILCKYEGKKKGQLKYLNRQMDGGM